MTTIHHYGDEGTVVTARQKAFAIFYVAAIAVLLLVHGAFREDVRREGVAGTRVTSSVQADGGAAITDPNGSPTFSPVETARAEDNQEARRAPWGR